MKVAEWLKKQGFVLNNDVWVQEGASNPSIGCIPDSLVQQAETDAGVASLIFKDVRTRHHVNRKGIDMHPRINEWSRKGRVE